MGHKLGIKLELELSGVEDEAESKMPSVTSLTLSVPPVVYAGGTSNTKPDERI